LPATATQVQGKEGEEGGGERGDEGSEKARPKLP